MNAGSALLGAPRTGRRLTAPFFEIGPKNLLRLPDIIEVTLAARHAGQRWGVSVVVTVPTALIARGAGRGTRVLVFAQSMDVDDLGPSVGRVIAESLVDAGAHGVMLNHTSNPLEPDRLRRGIQRAHANDLMTMVCAGTEDEVLRLLPLRPTTVLFEPPELIGHIGRSDRPWIPHVDTQVRAVAPDVLMMHAGGVAAPTDAYQIMRSGAAGTGSTSGVLRDESPTSAVGRFIPQSGTASTTTRTKDGEMTATTSPRTTVVVTGGARGIGFSLAEAFAANGMNVALLDLLDTVGESRRRSRARTAWTRSGSRSTSPISTPWPPPSTRWPRPRCPPGAPGRRRHLHLARQRGPARRAVAEGDLREPRRDVLRGPGVRQGTHRAPTAR